MSRFTESQIAVEAVKVVEEYGELTMGELIDILIERLKPSGHDMAIIANRSDTYFSQKVRNLRSHSNKVFLVMYIMIMKWINIFLVNARR